MTLLVGQSMVASRPPKLIKKGMDQTSTVQSDARVVKLKYPKVLPYQVKPEKPD